VWANGFASVVTTDAEIRASKNVAADEGSARLGADPTTKRISRRAGGQGSAEQLRADVEQVDAEAEFAERLMILRRTLAGEIQDAKSVDALRAVITSFVDEVEYVHEDDDEGFTLHRLVPRLNAKHDLWGDAEVLRLPETSSETKEPDHRIAAMRA
jgi:hypothetical protein